jgi:hypothetical protein
MEKHELSLIEAHIQSIKTSHAALGDSSEMDELFKVIHFPGFTTPAELAFLRASLDSIIAQTKQLAALRQGALTAAKLVATTRAAGA